MPLPIMYSWRAGNCPEHLMITSPYYRTVQVSGTHARDHTPEEIAEAERKKADRIAEREAARIAKAALLESQKAARKDRDAREKALRDEISKMRKAEYRAAHRKYTDAELRVARLANLARGRAKRIAADKAKAEARVAKVSAFQLLKEGIPEGWILASEASRLLCVSQSVISKYAISGVIKSYRISKYVYIDADELREVVSERKKAFQDHPPRAKA